MLVGRSRIWAVVGVTFVMVAALLLWAGTAWAAPATTIHSGSNARKQIALTFDDNVKVDRALAVLRALQTNEVPATLFLEGSPVASTPSINAEIVKGMMKGLFEVGDHSWSHPSLPGLSTSAMAHQIGGGTDAFRKATGARTVPLFRPPYGATNSQVAAVAGSEGFRYLVLWDIDPKDWSANSAATVASRVISRAHNGAIVVMHLSGAHTAAAIPSIVSDLRAKGYEFVTVSTMLKGDRLFVDVDTGSDSGQAVARMVQLGILSGYDGNYFGPSDTITRAQVAKVATLVAGIHTDAVENADRPSFVDVALRHDSNGNPVAYPFDYVEEAAAAGLVNGALGDGGVPVFRPNEPIKRVQLAQILARMARELKGYGLTGAGDSTAQAAEQPVVGFTDLPDYAVADVALVTRLGLMSGYSTGTFQSWSGAQRAHVALAMSRYLDLPAAQPAAP
ncbi:MAG: S-layer homology domain-containing protein [Thermoleophilia bacterium]|nr:S-layer homology domain-containing protein [Thermoleophilia bacterium]